MLFFEKILTKNFGQKLKLRRKKTDAAAKAINERHYDKEKAAKALKDAKKSLWRFERGFPKLPSSIRYMDEFTNRPTNVSRKEQRKQLKELDSNVRYWENRRREDLEEERRAQRIIRKFNK